ncbi:MAG TPA: 50S ribosomal protein L11 methyltransferase [Clostridiales bacterium]|jgi:ribosomal protein L11 methyltransferase|nr:50S ribosomal protein L11 methyltransferase [Clostridiales bacterium]
MEYIKIKLIDIAPDQIESLTAALSELGIDGTVIDDPGEIDRLLQKQNEYDWDYVDPSLRSAAAGPAAVSMFIPETMAGLELVDRVLDLAIAWGLSEAEIGSVSDSSWKDGWKDWFKPIDIAGKLWIRPSWETAAADPEVADIVIDPGTAFGTGDHATTRLCLEYLTEMVKPGISRVVDAGCGSGILAIAAAKLGARTVDAFDVDPEAIKVALENVARNGVNEKVHVRQADLRQLNALPPVAAQEVATAVRDMVAAGRETSAFIPAMPVDVLVANLNAALILEWLEEATGWLAAGGRLILSGLLIDQTGLVKQRLRELGYEEIDQQEDGEWAALTARKPVVRSPEQLVGEK